MMPCVVFLRDHIRRSRSVVLIDSGRGIVDGLGDALW